MKILILLLLLFAGCTRVYDNRKPELKYPENGFIGSELSHVQWLDTGADHYLLLMTKYKEDGDDMPHIGYKYSIVHHAETKDVYYSPCITLNDGMYFLQIRAHYKHESIWSNVYHFYIKN